MRRTAVVAPATRTLAMDPGSRTPGERTSVSVEEHKAQAPAHLRCAVLTVSTSRTEETDEAGRFVREALAGAGHEVVYYAVVRDDPIPIGAAVGEALERADVLIVNGGTGLSPFDLTIETVEPLFEKRMDGFGELFRWLSYREIGPAAMMSRAVAGVTRGRFVACLPGSPKAVRLAMRELLLPELGHVVQQLTKDASSPRGGGPGP